MSRPVTDITIVGTGFSGAVVAARLLQGARTPLTVRLIEATAVPELREHAREVADHLQRASL